MDNYVVHGVKRRSSSINTFRVDHIYQDPHEKNRKFILHYGDVTDAISVSSIIKKIMPTEIYNLAAQSHVAVSFEVPEYTANADAIGALRILEAIKFHGFEKKTKFYQAGTSEMFGKVKEIPQTEKTPFHPRSPYGVAKVYAHWITVHYREAFNIFACNGILFNHESPLRGETFVTRKISKAVGRIAAGIQEKVTLGNLDASRDWGYAKDYVQGMWLMMQHKNPEDWVLATGVTKTVKEFAIEAFKHVNLNWEDFVITSEKYLRPNEVDYLLGDSSKARKELHWKPSVDFSGLVKIMVEHDITEAKKDLALLKDNLISPTWEYPKI